ncbi:hypothetical protein WMY93_003603 [Mugilogobius chulae]|uniref:Septin-7 n=1 Tax=Mugilogobius chulae TaxID=88201 RepID=A0AAW0Q0C7_9GOBI
MFNLGHYRQQDMQGQLPSQNKVLLLRNAVPVERTCLEVGMSSCKLLVSHDLLVGGAGRGFRGTAEFGLPGSTLQQDSSLTLHSGADKEEEKELVSGDMFSEEERQRNVRGGCSEVKLVCQGELLLVLLLRREQEGEEGQGLEPQVCEVTIVSEVVSDAVLLGEGRVSVGARTLFHSEDSYGAARRAGGLYKGSTVQETQIGPVYGEKPSGPVLDFSYVGIDAILEQMRRKAMKQGFELNIMVVGQSGLGKSTLMNTLFKSKVSRKSVQATSQEKIPKTIEIKSISHDIEEKGVRMKLTVIDTPGFGDQINNENCWQPIMRFINDQYEAYLQEEININRKKRISDSRVHCCIYFIPPTGHCLRPLDVEFMRRLSKVVNIVPVIAKADTLTLEERDFFKQKIREELRANGIDIREMIPFAVVGSDQEYQVNGRRLLGRKTKWGTIEVENIAHCEFAYLRDLLIRTHMQNIKDITSTIHYEMYRVRRLNENNTGAVHTNGFSDHSAHEM